MTHHSLFSIFVVKPFSWRATNFHYRLRQGRGKWANWETHSAPSHLVKRIFRCWLYTSASPDSRVRPSLLGHEWNHPQLLTSERRRSTLQNHRGENIPGHLPLHRGPLPDDSAQESFLHGHRRGCPQGQDEPTAWSTLPVSQRCGTERKEGQGQVGPLILFFFAVGVKKPIDLHRQILPVALSIVPWTIELQWW